MFRGLFKVLTRERNTWLLLYYTISTQIFVADVVGITAFGPPIPNIYAHEPYTNTDINVIRRSARKGITNTSSHTVYVLIYTSTYTTTITITLAKRGNRQNIRHFFYTFVSQFIRVCQNIQFLFKYFFVKLIQLHSSFLKQNLLYTTTKWCCCCYRYSSIVVIVSFLPQIITIKQTLLNFFIRTQNSKKSHRIKQQTHVALLPTTDACYFTPNNRRMLLYS